MNLFQKIIKGDWSIGWWNKKSTINISITDFRYIRKKNKLEYPNDPDVNTKRQWGIRSNGAKRGVKEHTCLDISLELGHIHINYTNFEFNKGLR